MWGVLEEFPHTGQCYICMLNPIDVIGRLNTSNLKKVAMTVQEHSLW